jgi:signal transduction histidine kinase/DNA-binding response OmpR family regulator
VPLSLVPATEAPEQVDILVVDDLQEKLLVFKTVLEELGQNLVFVRSGAEALKEVLKREFAVILLDVNMPDIDGFETASLIRRYKKSAHTPIIFITAYADEMQTARGYSLGAVDYILSPVVPEVLRSKVRVFVELQVLQRRIARQADVRVAHAAAEAALQVAEESQRRAAYLSELSHALSGVLDLRAGMHRLLQLVVPRLAPGATVGLFEGNQLQQVASRADTESAVLDIDPAELAPADRERLRLSLQPALVGTDTSPRAYALRDGERPIGVLLLAGEPTALGAALLDEVATRAAIAFGAARLYRNLQQEIQERRHAEARLEEANKRKDEFLAMLSHELRNPLAPIGNAVEIIRRLAGSDPRLLWATDVTDRQVRQLTRLVDELLDVARIGQGKIVLQTQPLELATVVTQCLEMQRPALTVRRQTLTQSMPAQPVWIQGDPARLQQIINNLLNNANKYTPDGGSVHVTVAMEGGQAMLSVRDNGMGIEAELLPRVFELFEQGKRSLDRSQGGLGVGLTLVHRLVKLHEGRVEALSAGIGRGAEFRIHLPCLPIHTVAAPPPLAGTSANVPLARRVLLVEDNIDVAETTAAMLQLAGHTVHCAADGVQALAEAQSFNPEVVLLDIGLPQLDGYQVARRLRQMPATRHARLVALTGYGLPADRQRGRDAGFDHHLLKPVDPAALATLIEQGPVGERDGMDDFLDTGSGGMATLYPFRRP